FEIGYRGIDTAQLYKNEKVIGNFIKKNEINRDEIWITSKLYPKNKDIINSITQSLNDLNTKYINLFLIHFPTKDVLNQWQILEEYHNKGILLNIGLSNFNIKDIEEIIKNTKVPIY